MPKFFKTWSWQFGKRCTRACIQHLPKKSQHAQDAKILIRPTESVTEPRKNHSSSLLSWLVARVREDKVLLMAAADAMHRWIIARQRIRGSFVWIATYSILVDFSATRSHVYRRRFSRAGRLARTSVRAISWDSAKQSAIYWWAANAAAQSVITGRCYHYQRRSTASLINPCRPATPNDFGSRSWNHRYRGLRWSSSGLRGVNFLAIMEGRFIASAEPTYNRGWTLPPVGSTGRATWSWKHFNFQTCNAEANLSTFYLICKLFKYPRSKVLTRILEYSAYDVSQFHNIWHSEKFKSFAIKIVTNVN